MCFHFAPLALSFSLSRYIYIYLERERERERKYISYINTYIYVYVYIHEYVYMCIYICNSFFFFNFVCSGSLLHCNTQALHCGMWASLVVACGLSCPAACGILVPQPGIKPMSPALEGRLDRKSVV